MLTRRDFIRTGAAAGVAAAVIPTAGFASATITPSLPSLPIADALLICA